VSLGKIRGEPQDFHLPGKALEDFGQKPGQAGRVQGGVFPRGQVAGQGGTLDESEVVEFEAFHTLGRGEFGRSKHIGFGLAGNPRIR
jgi:hypothetical protein